MLVTAEKSHDVSIGNYEYCEREETHLDTNIELFS